jgi:hypothetical protein
VFCTGLHAPPEVHPAPLSVATGGSSLSQPTLKKMCASGGPAELACGFMSLASPVSRATPIPPSQRVLYTCHIVPSPHISSDDGPRFLSPFNKKKSKNEKQINKKSAFEDKWIYAWWIDAWFYAWIEVWIYAWFATQT